MAVHAHSVDNGGRANIPVELQGLLAMIEQDALHEGGARSRRHALETGKASLRNRHGGLHCDADDLSCEIFENEINLELILVTIVTD